MSFPCMTWSRSSWRQSPDHKLLRMVEWPLNMCRSARFGGWRVIAQISGYWAGQLIARVLDEHELALLDAAP